MSYSSVVLGNSPSSYWRLGEAAAATNAVDSAGAVTGTIGVQTTMGATGLLTGDADTCATFTNALANSKITFGASPYPFTGTATFSLELWIKPTAQAITNNAYLLSAASATDGWHVRFPGALVRFYRRVSSVDVTVDTGAASIVAGSTYHVVVTYDGTNSRIYLNGALSNTSASDTRSLVSAGVTLTLGQFQGGGNYMDGQVDEVAIYSGTVLSLAQVQAHYTAGTTNPASGFSNTVPPSLSGGLSIGGTLTINPGTWTPTPGSYTYAWDRADDTSGLNLARITTATGATYTLDAADAAKYIRAGVYPAA